MVVLVGAQQQPQCDKYVEEVERGPAPGSEGERRAATRHLSRGSAGLATKKLPPTLVDAEQDTTGITATLHIKQGRETVRADWLTGCDGAHNAVRKLAGIGFPGAAVAECFLLADVLATWESDRRVMTSWTDGGDMISVCRYLRAAE